MTVAEPDPITTVPTSTRAPTFPVLDEDGLLRFDDRWVHVPDAQLPVVELLISQPGRIVRTESIRSCYEANGGSASATAVRKMIDRIRTRLSKVGLHLHVVHGVGAILEVPTNIGANPAS